MSKNSQFFSKKIAANKAFFQKGQFISVGGGADSSFIAVAIALLDRIIASPTLYQQHTQILLKQYLNDFPDEKTMLELSLNPGEYIDLQLRTPRLKLDFIQKLAVTLRQLAVIEWCTTPLYYRSAFQGLSIEMMKTPGVAIDNRTAIAALASVFALPFKVSQIEQNKTLPLRFTYHSEAMTPKIPAIQLQAQANEYQPFLLQSSPLRNIDWQKGYPFLQFTLREKPVLGANQALALIAAEDKRIVQEYELITKRLKMMITTEEITPHDLLATYINSLEKMKEASPLGVEYGTQEFFSGVMRSTMPEKITLSYSESLTDSLIQRLAQCISTGLIDAEEIYNQLAHEDPLKSEAPAPHL